MGESERGGRWRASEGQRGGKRGRKSRQFSSRGKAGTRECERTVEMDVLLSGSLSSSSEKEEGGRRKRVQPRFPVAPPPWGVRRAEAWKVRGREDLRRPFDARYDRCSTRATQATNAEPAERERVSAVIDHRAYTANPLRQATRKERALPHTCKTL